MITYLSCFTSQFALFDARRERCRRVDELANGVDDLISRGAHCRDERLVRRLGRDGGGGADQGRRCARRFMRRCNKTRRINLKNVEVVVVVDIIDVNDDFFF